MFNKDLFGKYLDHFLGEAKITEQDHGRNTRSLVDKKTFVFKTMYSKFSTVIIGSILGYSARFMEPRMESANEINFHLEYDMSFRNKIKSILFDKISLNQEFVFAAVKKLYPTFVLKVDNVDEFVKEFIDYCFNTESIRKEIMQKISKFESEHGLDPSAIGKFLGESKE